MKNRILIHILSGLLLVASFSCSREPVIQPTEQNQMPKTAARIATHGIVYLPLNLTIKGNNKVYSGLWSQSVDLDADSLNDFTFSLSLYRSAGNDFYQFTTQIIATQAGGGVVSNYSPTALSGMPYSWISIPQVAGTPIGPTSTTFSCPSLPSTYVYSFYFGARRGGMIIGKGDKLVGMRFVSKGNTYFGWIKVNISSNSQTFIIREAAFMNVPDTPIAAGKML